ncbi:pirin family protein [Roseospira goensis]|uniref:Pirin family protein n=1 Tax=Roseospira goensis TaxID=391922 RepID=A0A7W6S2A5_9PROT|nr:hypothetical protein [Roseospira goensis]
MSWTACPEPVAPAPPAAADAAKADPVETVIVPRARDIGAFEVRRALPAAQRQMVGPFIFLDQMGPATFADGRGMDVRAHPHIGLATVTYLYKGGIQHRDSLGQDLEIRPGAVNWMIAGRGITHSERSPPARRRAGERLFGLQTWVALPQAHEETEPDFQHVPEADLPVIADTGTRVRVILGTAYGARAPVTVFSETLYADATLADGARLPLPDEHEDRGVYVVAGAVEVAGTRYEAGRLLVVRPGDAITLTARGETRLMLVGGATLEGPRHIWWNFVSSRPERIEAAKAAWAAGDWTDGPFRLPPSDSAETIPLPAG